MTGLNITPMQDSLAQEPELGLLRAELAAQNYKKAFALADDFLILRRDQRGIDLLAAAFKSCPGAHKPPNSPWGNFFSFCLIEDAGDEVKAGHALEKFADLPKPYAWMRYYRGSFRLHRKADLSALSDFRAAAKSAPDMWKARAYEAEILLCRGSLPKALAVFDELLEELQMGAHAEALAWRGALQLWAGEYSDAFDDLNRAVELTTQYAVGWRAGALVKLGRAKQALADLFQVDPSDQEARVWRAEALRALGRKKEALLELAPLIGDSPIPNFWAQANAALAGGDAQKLYAAVDPKIRAFIRLNDPLKFFARGLELGKGLRVPDRYLGAIWMRKQ